MEPGIFILASLYLVLIYNMDFMCGISSAHDTIALLIVQSWCPHCQHFKPQYIEFSNKIHEMSQKFHATVETFAISCVPQAKICQDNKIHGYPTVMFYPPNSTNGTKLQYFDLHPKEIFKMAGISIDVNEVDEKAVVNSDEHNDIPPKPYFIHRTRSETFHDAHNSFNFAMKTAIFTQSGPLPDKAKRALREFLLVMKRTVPLSSSMQPVVRDLLKNFESIVTSSAALNEIMAKHPPPKPINKWSTSSSQHGTGYTAGLWVLFHIMSVGLVQWNHFAIDDGQKLIPAEMADIQRNYIEHFFQCEACRLNFLSDFDACMYDRCNRLVTTAIGGTKQQFIQYPLWLYETHNAVNVRLRKERIEQNIENEHFTTQGEVVWPSFASCPSCWASGDKDRWDELEVYKFLQQSYW
jgi:thiol oxidase